MASISVHHRGFLQVINDEALKYSKVCAPFSENIRERDVFWIPESVMVTI